MPKFGRSLMVPHYIVEIGQRINGGGGCTKAYFEPPSVAETLAQRRSGAGGAAERHAEGGPGDFRRGHRVTICRIRGGCGRHCRLGARWVRHGETGYPPGLARWGRVESFRSRAAGNESVSFPPFWASRDSAMQFLVWAISRIVVSLSDLQGFWQNHKMRDL